MRKTFTLLIALMALTVSTWAMQITWNQADVQSVGISQYHGEYEPMSMTINGITVTATALGSEDYSGFYYDTYDNDDHYSYISLDNGGTITFATSLGVLSSIVIHLDAEKGSAYGYGEGWSENTPNALSWTGNAASVVLTNDGGQYGASIHHITSIDFTIVSVPTSTSWNLSDLASIGISQSHGNYEPMSQTINGITATATALGSEDYSGFYYDSDDNNGNISLENDGTFTFSSPFGNLASIIIHTTNEYGIYTSGWSWNETEHTLSWTGNAASVVLTDAYVSNIISIDFAFVTEEPEPDVPTHLVSTITWNTDDLATVNVPTNDFQTIKTIRVTNSCPDPYNDYCYFLYQDDPYNYCGFSMNNDGSLIFTPESGRLTSIVINWNYEGPDPDLVPGSGWSFTNSQLTWTSDDEDGAESVVLKSNSSDYLASGPIYSIVFTIAADPDAQGDVKWDQSALEDISLLAYDGTGSGINQTIDGIVATATAPEEGDYCHFLYDSPNDKVSMSIWGNGILTFAPETGRLTRIVIAGIVDSDDTNLSVESGWTSTANKLIWTGDPSFSVDLANASIDHITYVAFTIDDSDPSDTREVPELKFLNGGDELTEATIVKDIYGWTFEPGTYYNPSTEYFLYVNNGVMYYQDQPFIDWATPTEKGLTMTYSVSNNDVITLTKTSGNSFEFTVNGFGNAVVTAHTDGNAQYKPASITFTIHVVSGKAATKECVLAFVGGPNDGQIVPENYKFELETGQEMPWMQLREKSDPTIVYAPSFSIWGSRNYYVASIQAETKLRALTAGDDVFRVRYARYQDGDMNGEYKEIEIPVHIKPTEIALTTSVDFTSDPSSNSAIANNAAYDPITQQVQIGEVISDEVVQAALTCYAFGHPGWDENLQNTISFELPQGNGSLTVNGTVQDGCVLKVKIRGENGVHSFTPAQVASGQAIVNYNVPNQTAVVIYISNNGGSPAPRRAPAAKKDAPLAALTALSLTPTYPISANVDPDHAGVYYSTHFNETQKYALPNDGTKAFVAKIEGTDMIMTEIANGSQVIPANTAVILQSPTGSFSLTPSDGAEVTFDSDKNQLQGTDSEKTAPANCYVLSGHSTDGDVTGVGFYQFSGTIPAHKAYITVSGSAPAPKRLRFVFNGENAATGIGNASETLKSEKRIENGQLVIIKNGVRYNAQGQIVK